MQTITISDNKTLHMQWMFTMYTMAFTIPIFFSSPQIITGTLINSLLFLAAQRVSMKKVLPLLFLPSLGAIARGVLFGPQTYFLYYYLPCIWIGNYVLTQMFTRIPSKSYAIRICISSLSKFFVLQLFTQLYFKINVVPQIFVLSMGYIQLITALLGGLLVYGISYKQNYER
jgi:hypothetical protein